MEALQDSLDIVDIWLSKNGNSKHFTFRRGAYASRLDYWFISAHLMSPEASASITHIPLSDHAAIDVQLGARHVPRGPGLWRMDNELLADVDYKQAIQEIIEEEETHPQLQDPNAQWEWLKHRIKSKTILFAKTRRMERQKHESTLRQKMDVLHKEADEGVEVDPEELKSIERELREMELTKASRVIARSKANWALLGERPSRYFLNLEKVRAKSKTITHLINDQGDTISDAKEILAEQRRFYKDLYNQEAPSSPLDGPQQLGLNDDMIPKITEESKNRLEENYSKEELTKALNMLNLGKCPGSDGLTVEFYRTFWESLAPSFIRSLQCSLERGKLSVEQRRGVIVLIPKKDTNRSFIKNWRPISLLNTDYKIVTKAIATRLQSCIGQIIHPNQNGFVAKRYIGENIRTTQDIIDKVRDCNKQAFIVPLDYRKAFDSIRWSTLFRALEMFNFGDNFKDSIAMLFKDVETCTSNGDILPNILPPATE